MRSDSNKHEKAIGCGMKTKGTGYTPGLGPLVENVTVSQLDLCHRYIYLQGLREGLTGAAQTIKRYQRAYLRAG